MGGDRDGARAATGRRALITGISGQDGSYLAELLLAKDYSVYGLVRAASTPHVERLESILDSITLLPGDLDDQASLVAALSTSRPHEVYNLAAWSSVQSHEQPLHSAEISALGALRLMGAVHQTAPRARYFQATSSEVFSPVDGGPVNEGTPFHPASSHGVAKLMAHWATINQREAYGMHASSGILLPHASPRQSGEALCQRVASAAARASAGQRVELLLRDLDALREWGHARDTVDAIWRMLQRDEPRDLVIATGERHSLGEFCRLAFEYVDLDWLEYVRPEPASSSAVRTDDSLGDASRAREILGWAPRVSFPELVAEMVEAALAALPPQGRAGSS